MISGQLRNWFSLRPTFGNACELAIALRPAAELVYLEAQPRHTVSWLIRSGQLLSWCPLRPSLCTMLGVIA